MHTIARMLRCAEKDVPAFCRDLYVTTRELCLRDGMGEPPGYVCAMIVAMYQLKQQSEAPPAPPKGGKN